MGKCSSRSESNAGVITKKLIQATVQEICADPPWKSVLEDASSEARLFIVLLYLLTLDNDFVAEYGETISDRMDDLAEEMSVADWEYMVASAKTLGMTARILREFNRNLKWAKEREAEKGGECLRAFTVHPGWAWAIMTGVKKQEWRSFLPNPREGLCAIHVSKSYGRAQWEREAEFIKESWGVDLIPYEELVAEWCGKVVGVCNYAAGEEDWDEGSYGWRLSKVRPLKHRIACQGALKLWKMDAALSKKVLAEV